MTYNIIYLSIIGTAIALILLFLCFSQLRTSWLAKFAGGAASFFILLALFFTRMLERVTNETNSKQPLDNDEIFTPPVKPKSREIKEAVQIEKDNIDSIDSDHLSDIVRSYELRTKQSE